MNKQFPFNIDEDEDSKSQRFVSDIPFVPAHLSLCTKIFSCTQNTQLYFGPFENEQLTDLQLLIHVSYKFNFTIFIEKNTLRSLSYARNCCSTDISYHFLKDIRPSIHGRPQNCTPLPKFSPRVFHLSCLDLLRNKMV